ncbi:HlyD family type I secretion periplasmic adaptor subunit [Sphingopyxis sp. MWB1]|uniref:HlyD family type I secretion periplasmic adaptor subunit n=1 Tax=Sphingopyxis sp. MWB1 TaxID=1537715 RepID=UPI000ACFA118|nr:HlyD family type I secretion periplasmic adaptor subunit [Sphingopyxis sp. MWB1]
MRSAVAADKARSKSLLRTEEVTFLPAALEIVERPVSPTARATAWIMLAGLALAIGWLTFGKVDVVASASGRLIPVDHVKVIQPAEAGVVRNILVRDGERVRKGETLIELDPTMSSAEAVQAERALEVAQLDAARARAIISALDGNGVAFVAPPGTAFETARSQEALARAQFEDIRATTVRHRAEWQAAVAARGEADVEVAKLAETMPLLDEQIAANEALLQKGFVSKLKVIEMRRQRLATGRDYEIALQTSSKASAQIHVAQGAIMQSEAEARSRILTDLTRAEAEATLRREELRKARQRSSLQRLVSPVDGTIAQLTVHTIGGVLEAAKPIMVVVPSDGKLVAEVKVLNKDAGFVRIGQPVALKLEAFPFTRHGTLPGKIQSIGSDSVADEKLGLVYVARVTLEQTFIDRDGVRSTLTPGMSVTADIRTGLRSILSYLISPLEKARLEAGRER